MFFHSYAGWVAALRRRRQNLRDTRIVTQFHGLEPLYHEAMTAEMALAGRPFRWRYRIGAGWLLPKLIRFATRRSDVVFCLNEREAAYLRSEGWSRPERTVVLSNLVEDEFFVERSFRLRGQRILFVGQWHEGKGIRYLAEAFSRLASRFPEALLRCVGVRSEPETVRASFPAEVRGRVEVVPELDHAALVAEYAAADYFVLPSLSEGSSLALLEAMAAALPIACTPVGTAPDLLRDGESAEFSEPGNAAQLEGSLVALLSDSNRAQALGEAARRIAEDYRVSAGKSRFTELVRGLCEASAT